MKIQKPLKWDQQRIAVLERAERLIMQKTAFIQTMAVFSAASVIVYLNDLQFGLFGFSTATHSSLLPAAMVLMILFLPAALTLKLVEKQFSKLLDESYSH